MRSLVNEFGHEVECICWDEGKKTPFVPVNENGITFYKRSGFDKKSMISFIESKNPLLIYVSGRMDKVYLEAVLHFRDKIKIVSGCDNQWENTPKNKIAALFSNSVYRKYFDYMWVASQRSYEYMRRMGYAKNRIVNNMYTGDATVFMGAYGNNKTAKAEKYPHKFVFVGRFAPEKGLNLLIEAFIAAKNEIKNDWSLTLVGAGNTPVVDSPFVEIRNFMSSAELASESKNWGVFCLPSLKEPWGVVVHEFSMAGLPVICSDNVGAGDSLVINNYNGFVFETGNVAQLKSCLMKMMLKTDIELSTMSARSHEISKCQSPLIAAYSLMGIIK